MKWRYIWDNLQSDAFPELLSQAIQNGFDIHYKFGSKTIFQHALAIKSLSHINIILEYGFNPNHSSSLEHCPLVAVIQAIDWSTFAFDCINSLLQYGADVNIIDPITLLTPLAQLLRHSTPFHQQHIYILQQLLAHDALTGYGVHNTSYTGYEPRHNHPLFYLYTNSIQVQAHTACFKEILRLVYNHSSQLHLYPFETLGNDCQLSSVPYPVVSQLQHYEEVAQHRTKKISERKPLLSLSSFSIKRKGSERGSDRDPPQMHPAATTTGDGGHGEQDRHPSLSYIPLCNAVQRDHKEIFLHFPIELLFCSLYHHKLPPYELIYDILCVTDTFLHPDSSWIDDSSAFTDHPSLPRSLQRALSQQLGFRLVKHIITFPEPYNMNTINLLLMMLSPYNMIIPQQRDVPTPSTATITAGATAATSVELSNNRQYNDSTQPPTQQAVRGHAQTQPEIQPTQAPPQTKGDGGGGTDHHTIDILSSPAGATSPPAKGGGMTPTKSHISTTPSTKHPIKTVIERNNHFYLIFSQLFYCKTLTDRAGFHPLPKLRYAVTTTSQMDSSLFLFTMVENRENLSLSSSLSTPISSSVRLSPGPEGEAEPYTTRKSRLYPNTPSEYHTFESLFYKPSPKLQGRWLANPIISTPITLHSILPMKDDYEYYSILRQFPPTYQRALYQYTHLMCLPMMTHTPSTFALIDDIVTDSVSIQTALLTLYNTPDIPPSLRKQCLETYEWIRLSPIASILSPLTITERSTFAGASTQIPGISSLASSGSQAASSSGSRHLGTSAPQSASHAASTDPRLRWLLTLDYDIMSHCVIPIHKWLNRCTYHFDLIYAREMSNLPHIPPITRAHPAAAMASGHTAVMGSDDGKQPFAPLLQPNPHNHHYNPPSLQDQHHHHHVSGLGGGDGNTGEHNPGPGQYPNSRIQLVNTLLAKLKALFYVYRPFDVYFQVIYEILLSASIQIPLCQEFVWSRVKYLESHQQAMDSYYSRHNHQQHQHQQQHPGHHKKSHRLGASGATSVSATAASQANPSGMDPVSTNKAASPSLALTDTTTKDDLSTAGRPRQGSQPSQRQIKEKQPSAKPSTAAPHRSMEAQISPSIQYGLPPQAGQHTTHSGAAQDSAMSSEAYMSPLGDPTLASSLFDTSHHHQNPHVDQNHTVVQMQGVQMHTGESDTESDLAAEASGEGYEDCMDHEYHKSNDILITDDPLTHHPESFLDQLGRHVFTEHFHQAHQRMTPDGRLAENGPFALHFGKTSQKPFLPTVNGFTIDQYKLATHRLSSIALYAAVINVWQPNLRFLLHLCVEYGASTSLFLVAPYRTLLASAIYALDLPQSVTTPSLVSPSANGIVLPPIPWQLTPTPTERHLSPVYLEFNESSSPYHQPSHLGVPHNVNPTTGANSTTHQSGIELTSIGNQTSYAYGTATNSHPHQAMHLPPQQQPEMIDFDSEFARFLQLLTENGCDGYNVMYLNSFIPRQYRKLPPMVSQHRSHSRLGGGGGSATSIVNPYALTPIISRTRQTHMGSHSSSMMQQQMRAYDGDSILRSVLHITLLVDRSPYYDVYKHQLLRLVPHHPMHGIHRCIEISQRKIRYTIKRICGKLFPCMYPKRSSSDQGSYSVQPFPQPNAPKPSQASVSSLHDYHDPNAIAMWTPHQPSESKPAQLSLFSLDVTVYSVLAPIMVYLTGFSHSVDQHGEFVAFPTSAKVIPPFSSPLWSPDTSIPTLYQYDRVLQLFIFLDRYVAHGGVHFRTMDSHNDSFFTNYSGGGDSLLACPGTNTHGNGMVTNSTKSLLSACTSEQLLTSLCYGLGHLSPSVTAKFSPTLSQFYVNHNAIGTYLYRTYLKYHSPSKLSSILTERALFAHLFATISVPPAILAYLEYPVYADIFKTHLHNALRRQRTREPSFISLTPVEHPSTRHLLRQQIETAITRVCNHYVTHSTGYRTIYQLLEYTLLLLHEDIAEIYYETLRTAGDGTPSQQYHHQSNDQKPNDRAPGGGQEPRPQPAIQRTMPPTILTINLSKLLLSSAPFTIDTLRIVGVLSNLGLFYSLCEFSPTGNPAEHRPPRVDIIDVLFSNSSASAVNGPSSTASSGDGSRQGQIPLHRNISYHRSGSSGTAYYKRWSNDDHMLPTPRALANDHETVEEDDYIAMVGHAQPQLTPTVTQAYPIEQPPSDGMAQTQNLQRQLSLPSRISTSHQGGRTSSSSSYYGPNAMRISAASRASPMSCDHRDGQPIPMGSADGGGGTHTATRSQQDYLSTIRYPDELLSNLNVQFSTPISLPQSSKTAKGVKVMTDYPMLYVLLIASHIQPVSWIYVDLFTMLFGNCPNIFQSTLELEMSPLSVFLANVNDFNDHTLLMVQYMLFPPAKYISIAGFAMTHFKPSRMSHSAAADDQQKQIATDPSIQHVNAAFTAGNESPLTAYAPTGGDPFPLIQMPPARQDVRGKHHNNASYEHHQQYDTLYRHHQHNAHNHGQTQTIPSNTPKLSVSPSSRDIVFQPDLLQQIILPVTQTSPYVHSTFWNELSNSVVTPTYAEAFALHSYLALYHKRFITDHEPMHAHAHAQYDDAGPAPVAGGEVTSETRSPATQSGFEPRLSMTPGSGMYTQDSPGFVAREMQGRDGQRKPRILPINLSGQDHGVFPLPKSGGGTSKQLSPQIAAIPSSIGSATAGDLPPHRISTPSPLMHGRQLPFRQPTPTHTEMYAATQIDLTNHPDLLSDVHGEAQFGPQIGHHFHHGHDNSTAERHTGEGDLSSKIIPHGAVFPGQSCGGGSPYDEPDFPSIVGLRKTSQSTSTTNQGMSTPSQLARSSTLTSDLQQSKMYKDLSWSHLALGNSDRDRDQEDSVTHYQLRKSSHDGDDDDDHHQNGHKSRHRSHHESSYSYSQDEDGPSVSHISKSSLQLPSNQYDITSSQHVTTPSTFAFPTNPTSVFKTHPSGSFAHIPNVTMLDPTAALMYLLLRPGKFIPNLTPFLPQDAQPPFHQNQIRPSPTPACYSPWTSPDGETDRQDEHAPRIPKHQFFDHSGLGLPPLDNPSRTGTSTSAPTMGMGMGTGMASVDHQHTSIHPHPHHNVSHLPDLPPVLVAIVHQILSVAPSHQLNNPMYIPKQLKGVTHFMNLCTSPQHQTKPLKKELTSITTLLQLLLSFTLTQVKFDQYTAQFLHGVISKYGLRLDNPHFSGSTPSTAGLDNAGHSHASQYDPSLILPELYALIQKDSLNSGLVRMQGADLPWKLYHPFDPLKYCLFINNQHYLLRNKLNVHYRDLIMHLISVSIPPHDDANVTPPIARPLQSVTVTWDECLDSDDNDNVDSLHQPQLHPPRPITSFHSDMLYKISSYASRNSIALSNSSYPDIPSSLTAYFSQKRRDLHSKFTERSIPLRALFSPPTLVSPSLNMQPSAMVASTMGSPTTTTTTAAASTVSTGSSDQPIYPPQELKDTLIAGFLVGHTAFNYDSIELFYQLLSIQHINVNFTQLNSFTIPEYDILSSTATFPIPYLHSMSSSSLSSSLTSLSQQKQQLSSTRNLPLGLSGVVFPAFPFSAIGLKTYRAKTTESSPPAPHCMCSDSAAYLHYLSPIRSTTSLGMKPTPVLPPVLQYSLHSNASTPQKLCTCKPVSVTVDFYSRQQWEIAPCDQLHRRLLSYIHTKLITQTVVWTPSMIRLYSVSIPATASPAVITTSPHSLLPALKTAPVPVVDTEQTNTRAARRSISRSRRLSERLSASAAPRGHNPAHTTRTLAASSAFEASTGDFNDYDKDGGRAITRHAGTAIASEHHPHQQYTVPTYDHSIHSKSTLSNSFFPSTASESKFHSPFKKGGIRNAVASHMSSAVAVDPSSGSSGGGGGGGTSLMVESTTVDMEHEDYHTDPLLVLKSTMIRSYYWYTNHIKYLPNNRRYVNAVHALANHPDPLVRVALFGSLDTAAQYQSVAGVANAPPLPVVFTNMEDEIDARLHAVENVLLHRLEQVQDVIGATLPSPQDLHDQTMDVDLTQWCQPPRDCDPIEKSGATMNSDSQATSAGATPMAHTGVGAGPGESNTSWASHESYNNPTKRMTGYDSDATSTVDEDSSSIKFLSLLHILDNLPNYGDLADGHPLSQHFLSQDTLHTLSELPSSLLLSPLSKWFISINVLHPQPQLDRQSMFYSSSSQELPQQHQSDSSMPSSVVAKSTPQDHHQHHPHDAGADVEQMPAQGDIDMLHYALANCENPHATIFHWMLTFATYFSHYLTPRNTIPTYDGTTGLMWYLVHNCYPSIDDLTSLLLLSDPESILYNSMSPLFPRLAEKIGAPLGAPDGDAFTSFAGTDLGVSLQLSSSSSSLKSPNQSHGQYHHAGRAAFATSKLPTRKLGSASPEHQVFDPPTKSKRPTSSLSISSLPRSSTNLYRGSVRIDDDHHHLHSSEDSSIDGYTATSDLLSDENMSDYFTSLHIHDHDDDLLENSIYVRRCPISLTHMNENHETLFMHAILRRWQENALLFILNSVGLEAVFTAQDHLGFTALEYLDFCNTKHYAPDLVDYITTAYTGYSTPATHLELQYDHTQQTPMAP